MDQNAIITGTALNALYQDLTQDQRAAFAHLTRDFGLSTLQACRSLGLDKHVVTLIQSDPPRSKESLMSLKDLGTKSVFTYTLYVSGVFGRNRKAKREHIKLYEAETEKAQPTEADLSRSVGEKLVAIKAKPGLTWKLVQQAEKLQSYETETGAILETRSFQLFTDQKTLCVGTV